jgi:Raf kinase inhibitor-like YbhB/YbcL family protein
MKRQKCLSFLLSILGFSLIFATYGTSNVEALELSSPAFENGGKIPIQYVMPGAGGKNISIPLVWKNAPAETKSFAISMVDIHPVAKSWVHWLIINIPASVNSLPEGASRSAMPAGSKELKNSWGNIGYGGPQPPPGTGEHTYVITIYALKVESLDLPVEASLDDFRKAIEGKVLDSASISGKYGR